MMAQLTSIEMRPTTEEDKYLSAYDNTKLMNINTCPTWGIVRYGHHLRMPNAGRALALEAGDVSHQAFSAGRWFQFRHYSGTGKRHSDLCDFHGHRLFGADRFRELLATQSNTATERTNLLNFVLETLNTSGYYDDISDRNRTISNIEESLIAWCDRYDMERYPIWIRDTNDPQSDIGIEIPFDLVVTFGFDDDINTQTRFTGKMDGLHWDKDNLIIIEEKTSSGLSDAWLSQCVLSHQITGYCLAAASFTNEPCHKALVSGMRIPLGRQIAEGIRKEPVNRSQDMFERWAHWFITTVDMEQKYTGDVVKAPMYTHSCSRYFRTCSFLPLCAAEDDEERRQILEEMEFDEWSPLHDN